MASRASIYQTGDGSISLSQAQVSALIEYLMSLK
jgi:hypothetical protein